jgi:hypothetical protein
MGARRFETIFEASQWNRRRAGASRLPPGTDDARLCHQRSGGVILPRTH